ncbi:MAG TPA: DUF72 domain-containing protein [Saprospiraceae bacterium]|nr:DUF72 domain-containing protein [Saprospiraceae bacterium]
MNNELLKNSFYSGLSGLELPVPKYLFPPPYQDASRLTYYSSFFNSIEINSSFYKVPLAKTISNWNSSVNEDFRFTFKLWKQVTHNKGLSFERSDVELFLKSISHAGQKRGCILIQFPPSLSIDHKLQLENLLGVITEIDVDHLWNIALEFRHKSWYHESVFELVDLHNSTIVIQDIPKSATPLLDLQSEIIYVRFHGPTGNYRGGYTDEVLSEYAFYILDWVDEGKKVFVYFNNTMGDAFKNLQKLKSFVFDNLG